MPVELVKFPAADGYEIDGLYARSPAPRVVVIHVHGKCGNFYQNAFIREMFRVYSAHGLSFLTFNNRGHDCVAEAYISKTLGYRGGSLERFEECIIDIDSAINYVKRDHNEVYLQGHSHGCEKIVFAMQVQMPTVNGIILLSPADSKRLHQAYIYPATIDTQIEHLRKVCSEFSFLPANQYGIRAGETEYFIPVFRDSLLATLEGPALEIFDFEESFHGRAVLAPTFVYLGEQDPLLTAPIAEIQKRLSCMFPHLRYFIARGGNHHFTGLEREVATAVASWISASVGGSSDS